IQRQRTTVASHERIGIFRVFGRDAGFTALYTAYTTSIRCVVPEYKVNLDKLIRLLVEEKRANPSNYALVVLSEGAEWEGYQVREYGDPDAYGHRKKASVAESLADEIKRRTGEETMTSDLTYDLRSGDPDFVDKLSGPDVRQHGLRCHAGGADRRHVGAGEGLLRAGAHPRSQARAAQVGRRYHVQYGALSSHVRQQAGATGLSAARVIGQLAESGLPDGCAGFILRPTVSPPEELLSGSAR